MATSAAQANNTWSCSSCTLINSNASNTCKACNNCADEKNSELRQLSTLYFNSYELINHAVDLSKTIQIKFNPSDPDFPYALPVGGLTLQYTLLSNYPAANSVSVQILNSAQFLPQRLNKLLVDSVMRYVKTQYGREKIVWNSLKFLDKNISELIAIGLTVIEKEEAKLFDILHKQANLQAAKELEQHNSQAETLKHSSTVTTTTMTTKDLPPFQTVQAAVHNPSSKAAGEEQKRKARGLGFKIIDLTNKSKQHTAMEAQTKLTQELELLEQKQAEQLKAAEIYHSASDQWTVQQQKQLEAALRQYPKSLVPAQLSKAQRWSKISALVSDKSKQQVIDRFKYLQAQAKSSAVADSKQSEELQPAEEEMSSLLQRRVQDQQLDRQYAESKQSEESNSAEADEEEANSFFAINSGIANKFQHPAESKIHLNQQHRGTQILCEKVGLTNISLVKCSSLQFQLSCLRCSTINETELQPSSSHALEFPCVSCHLSLSVRYRHELMHDNNSSLGYLDLENCNAHDLLRVNLWLTCENCFNESSAKDYQRDTHFEGNCFNCHEKLEMKISNFSLNIITPPLQNLQRKDVEKYSKENNPFINDAERELRRIIKAERAALKLNSPLPSNGACEYYRKSYRHLRFPCCSRSFCCDRHHDKASDHQFMWANRMICGLCSKEQPFSQAPCNNCGFNFVSISSSFWEGGRGQRNRSEMNRNDSKKYSGLNKTQSKHSDRVGQKKK
jgi:chemotaxis protein histidine kinase CheA